LDQNKDPDPDKKKKFELYLDFLLEYEEFHAKETEAGEKIQWFIAVVQR
jgi:hypothetical protein